MDHSLHTAALQNAMPSDSNNQPTTLTRLCQPQYTPDKASAPDFDVALRSLLDTMHAGLEKAGRFW